MPTTSQKRPAPPRTRRVPEPAPAVPEMAAACKRFIYKAEVVERIGVSYVAIWRWMGDGEFPLGREVGGRVAWLESEIDDWMMSRPPRKYKTSAPRAGAK